MASTCPSPDYANASIFQKYDSTNEKQALLMSTEKYNNSFISLNVYNAAGNPVNELKADGETISQICYKDTDNFYHNIDNCHNNINANGTQKGSGADAAKLWLLHAEDATDPGNDKYIKDASTAAEKFTDVWDKTPADRGDNIIYKSQDICRSIAPCPLIKEESLCVISGGGRCIYDNGKCKDNPGKWEPEIIENCNDTKFHLWTLTDSIATGLWGLLVMILIFSVVYRLKVSMMFLRYKRYKRMVLTALFVIFIYFFVFILPHIMSLLFLDSSACMGKSEQEYNKGKCEYVSKAPDIIRKTGCSAYGERCSNVDGTCKYNCSINPFILFRELFLGPKNIPERNFLQKAIHFIFKTLLMFVPYCVVAYFTVSLIARYQVGFKDMHKLEIIIAFVILLFLPLFIMIESQSTHPAIIKRISVINSSRSNYYCWVNNYGGIVPYIALLILSITYSAYGEF